METQQFQPKKKTSTGRIILYVVLAIIALNFVRYSMGDSKEAAAAEEPKTGEPAQTEAATVAPAEQETTDAELEQVTAKLKAKAEQSWPDDYGTQEFWVNQEIEDYQYMKTIEDNSIKRKAQRDWPLDFSTQKFWYDEQIAAKERLGK